MKKILTLLVVATMSLSAFAQSFQPPTKEINWFGNGKEYGDEGDAEEGTGIRREKNDANPVPVAPATLLLLGLGGAAVGTKVLRNTKK